MLKYISALIKRILTKLIWDTRYDKSRNLVLSWIKRNLTILGHILIVKTLIIPYFTFFLANVKVVGNSNILELKTKIFSFILAGKKDKFN